MCSRMLMSTLPCGFKMRRTCSIHATVHAGYSSSGTPPYSFARCIAYGGEVTTASTLLSGNCRMTSRQSPSYNVHSDTESLLIHDPSVLTVRGSRAGVLTVAVQTVPTLIAEIAALGVGFVFPKEPKTRLVVMLSSHGNHPFAPTASLL